MSQNASVLASCGLGREVHGSPKFCHLFYLIITSGNREKMQVWGLSLFVEWQRHMLKSPLL